MHRTNPSCSLYCGSEGGDGKEKGNVGSGGGVCEPEGLAKWSGHWAHEGQLQSSASERGFRGGRIRLLKRFRRDVIKKMMQGGK